MIKPVTLPPDIISPSYTDYSSVAATVIGAGGIVAVPTETSYGLAVDPFNDEAVKKLYEIKKRPASKPILLLIDELSRLETIVRDIPLPYHALIEQFWPGPLTLIFPALQNISLLLTGETGTIGVRLTSNPIVSGICRTLRSPITGTSANLSGRPSASSTNDLISYFPRGVDLIIDGGKMPRGLCSTIVAYRNSRLEVLRRGVIKINTR